MRLPVEVARQRLAFRARAVSAFEELRAALGGACGELWFRDWRLQVGVSASGDPPVGAHVQAAKLVLERHGLLEQSDFVVGGASTAQMLAASDRVAAMLVGWLFARVALRSPHFAQGNTLAGHHLSRSLWIETLDGLTDEQRIMVDAAIAVAGVPVEVSASLGPGPRYSPIPVRDVEWTLVSVGADGRSLLINHHWAGGLGTQACLALEETDTQITIGIALADLRRDPHAGPNYAIPAVLGMRTLTAHLDEPVGGRRITGPQCSLHSDRLRVAYRPQLMPDGTTPQLVPNVVGLALEDAKAVLRLQDFEPKLVGSGQQIVTQDARAESITEGNGASVVITAGP
jgi:hypothetical protein